jgi:replicative DNA helicase
MPGKALVNGNHTPSFIHNPENEYFKCTSGCGQGDILDFMQMMENCDLKTAIDLLRQIAGIEDELPDKLQDKHLKYLAGRGITERFAVKYGLEGENDYIRFPQKRNGFTDGWKYLGITKFKGKKRNQFFKGNDTKSKLFPDYKLGQAEILIICAGEYDCIVLDQELYKQLEPNEYFKYRVKTNATGESNYPSDMIEKFSKQDHKLKEIWIVYDNDKEGQAGAEKIADELSQLEIPVFKITFPDSKPLKYDVSDFLVKENHKISQFLELDRSLHIRAEPIEKETEGKILPANKLSFENERLLLNYAVKNNEFIYDMTEKLNPADFLNEKFRKIYKFILENYDGLKKITFDGLDHYLETDISNEIMFASDGYSIQTFTEFEFHIESQLDYSMQQKFRNYMNQAYKLLQSDSQISKEKLIDFITDNTDNFLTSGKSVFTTSVREMKYRFINTDDKKEVFPTQFDELNDLLGGGVARGKLTIVGGRPSLGKTTCVIQICEHFAEMGFKPKIYSLETDEEEVVHQMYARELEKDTNYFRHRWFKDDELGIKKHDQEFYFTDKLFTPEQIVNDIKISARKDGCKIFVIDHFQLLQNKSNKKRLDFYTEWSAKLQQVAKQENVSIILLSQLTRNVEQKLIPKPSLSDLKETGSLEQDAHTVIFLYSPDKKNQQSSPSIALSVAKCKTGRPGEVKMVFDRPCAKFHQFSDCSQDYLSKFGELI